MIALGIVKVVKEKPTCVSPLGVSWRNNKPRLVWDASRWVNKFLKNQKVTLTGLDKALEMTNVNDWQVTFDLKSAYYNIRIFEPHQRFLGAAIDNSDGSRTYFVYKVLPFGLSSAVHAITKLWKPIIARFHKEGMPSTIYIDDGRILAGSKEEAETKRIRAYEIVESAGWQISKEKSDSKKSASQSKKYLGFIIDSKRMFVYAPEEKMIVIKEMLDTLKETTKIRVKELARILGKITSLTPSHGPLARICCRSSFCLIDAHVEEKGWKGEVELQLAAIRELRFFTDNIFTLNGQPIQSSMRKVKVNSIFDNAISTSSEVRRLKEECTKKICSDASSFKVAIMDLTKSNSIDSKLNFQLTKTEASKSSGYRELLAVQKAIRHWSETNPSSFKRQFIYWATDSTNLVSFLTKGSSKKDIQEIVFDIYKRLHDIKSEIIPIHLRRQDERVTEADAISKTLNSDDWSIDVLSFDCIQQEFNLEIDLFTSEINARLPKFFSEFYHEKSLGVEAFSHVWDIGSLWICPPIKLLPNVAKRIRSCNCEGVVILPNWPTSNFYCDFFKDNSPKPPFKLVRIFNPFIYQNQNAKSALCGKVEFKFLALYFNTHQ